MASRLGLLWWTCLAVGATSRRWRWVGRNLLCSSNGCRIRPWKHPKLGEFELEVDVIDVLDCSAAKCGGASRGAC